MSPVYLTISVPLLQRRLLIIPGDLLFKFEEARRILELNFLLF